MSSENVDNLIKKGKALVELEQYEDAIALFKKALSLDENNVEVLQKLGKVFSSYANALVKVEKIEESLPFWQKALKIEPDNVLAIGNYANVLMKSKGIEDSLSYFLEKSLKIKNNTYTLYRYVIAFRINSVCFK